MIAFPSPGIIAGPRLVLGAGVGDPPPFSTRWRLFFEAVNGSTEVNAAEVEMRASVGGADQCSGGTATASNSLSGTYLPANAFDGSSGTFWVTGGSGAVNGWLEYEFPSAVQVVETTYKVRGDGYQSEAPVDCRLEYWDGSAFQTWALFRGENYWALGDTRRFVKATTPATADHYAYWRLRETDTFGSGNLVVQEVAMFEGGTDVTAIDMTSPLGTVASSGATRADTAFDGTGLGNGYVPISYPAYLGGRFGTPRKITSVAVTSSFSGFEARCFKSFVIEASNDWTTWVTKKTVTGESAWSASETRTYTI